VLQRQEASHCPANWRVHKFHKGNTFYTPLPGVGDCQN